MTCPTNKKSYPNGPTAIVAKMSVEAKFGGFMRAYQCDRCNQWHLTKIMHHNRILNSKMKGLKS